MGDSITVRRMYKYRLYRCDKKDLKLRHRLFVASTVWNHFIALQRRYYRLMGGYITYNQMSSHVLKLRKTRRFGLWRDLHSQVCQNVCHRVDDAYQRFFNGLIKSRPKFKKASKYKSFTFPQSGYKVQGNRLTIDGVSYKFVKHREIGGDIKTLTIKRDSVGTLWIVFSVVETISIQSSSTGKSGGFDFGLKTFLVNDEGIPYVHPQIFTQRLRQTRRLNLQLSRKVAGSKRQKRAKRALANHGAEMANKRRDHHFKLAHRLCDEYDVMYFEDLNLEGMKALWGRKVSDLSFGSFLSILEWVAVKRGKRVIKIDRWHASTQTCHVCKHKNATLTLRDREWVCPQCGTHHLRDHNSAINVKTVGASTGYRSERKPQVRLRSRAEGRSRRL